MSGSSRFLFWIGLNGKRDSFPKSWCGLLGKLRQESICLDLGAKFGVLVDVQRVVNEHICAIESVHVAVAVAIAIAMCDGD